MASLMSVLLVTKVRRWLRTACVGMAMMAPAIGTAWAIDLPGNTPQGFTVQVKGEEFGTWDSNPLRLTTGARALTGSNTTAEMILGDHTPLSLLSLDSVVTQNIFDNSNFNSTDFHETADLFTSNERWLAGMEGHVDYDTTRTSEITSFNVAAPDIRHTGLALTPQLSFTPNTIDTYSINGNVLSSTYDNKIFVDYSVYGVNPTYAHNFDPMNAGLLTLNAERYQTEEGPRSSVDTIGPSLGWTSIINQRLTTKVTAGTEESTQEGANSERSSRLNFVFSGKATFKGQQDLADFIASRTQQPFGNGSSSLLTSFNVDEAHTLNDDITLNAAAGYRVANYSSSDGINLNNEISGSAGLAYHVLEHLDVTANYQYLDQTLTGISGTIKEQTIMFGLTFHPTIGAI